MEIEEIYRRYFTDVYRYLLRMCADPSLAEEITAETFFRALQALPDFRGDCQVRVWLCQIAKHVYFSGARRKKREIPMPEERWPIEGEEDPAETALLRGEAERLREQVHKLTEPYREVLLWRVYGDVSFQEIGKLFGRDAGWARVTYHRACAKARREARETENGRSLPLRPALGPDAGGALQGEVPPAPPEKNTKRRKKSG